MKTNLLIKCCLLALIGVINNSYSQLVLKDDSVTIKNEIPSNSTLGVNKFKELNDFSRYSGSIQGFSGFCKYDIESQKLFFNSFNNKIKALNLTKEESDIIANSFKNAANDVRLNGIKNLTCAKFKEDFNKIIETLK